MWILGLSYFEIMPLSIQLGGANLSLGARLKKQLELNIKDGETNVVLFVGVNGVGKTTSIAKIANKYNSAVGKTDLALLLYNINKETENRFNYKINFNTLRKNLDLLLDNVPNNAAWNNMSNDEIIKYLKSIFADDPKLIKAYVKLEYSRRRDAEKVQAALEEMTERDNELNILYGRE